MKIGNIPTKHLQLPEQQMLQEQRNSTSPTHVCRHRTTDSTTTTVVQQQEYWYVVSCRLAACHWIFCILGVDACDECPQNKIWNVKYESHLKPVQEIRSCVGTDRTETAGSRNAMSCRLTTSRWVWATALLVLLDCIWGAACCLHVKPVRLVSYYSCKPSEKFVCVCYMSCCHTKPLFLLVRPSHQNSALIISSMYTPRGYRLHQERQPTFVSKAHKKPTE